MGKRFSGPDPSEYLPHQQQLVPLSELEVPGSPLSRSEAVLFALLAPTHDYIHQKFEDELYITDIDGESRVGPDCVQKSLERIKLIGTLLRRTLIDVDGGSDDTLESLNTVKDASINAYTRDACMPNFLRLSSEDLSLNDVEAINATADQATDEVDSFIGYLCVHFEEPKPGIDY